MRPPRTPSLSPDAAACGEATTTRVGGVSGSGATGEPPRPAGGAGSPRRSDGGGSAPSTADGRPDSEEASRTVLVSPVFLGHLAVRDHARLAERLADDIGRLRHARITHNDIGQVRDQLEAFLTDDLIPFLHAEDDALIEAAGHAHRPGRWSRGQRVNRRRSRDHRRVIDAVHALQRADTPLLALARAERVRALFFAHLIGEDRDLLAAARAEADGHSGQRAGTDGLVAELGELLAHDHARITAAVTTAREAAAAGSEDEVGACDRATAALSQHAAVMATRAYPMVWRVLPKPERAVIGPLTEDLRCAERAMRHLNRLLGGRRARTRTTGDGCGATSSRRGSATWSTRSR